MAEGKGFNYPRLGIGNGQLRLGRLDKSPLAHKAQVDYPVLQLRPFENEGRLRLLFLRLGLVLSALTGQGLVLTYGRKKVGIILREVSLSLALIGQRVHRQTHKAHKPRSSLIYAENYKRHREAQKQQKQKKVFFYSLFHLVT